jgi:hypothetical protein
MPNTPRQNIPIDVEQGCPMQFQVADPGAGNQWIFTLPQIENQWRYRVLCVQFTLSTVGAGADRLPGLRIFRHVLAWNLWRCYANGQATGGVRKYAFYVNCPVAFADNYVNGQANYPLLDTSYTSWKRIGSTVQNMLATDSMTQISITIERWIDPEDSN